MYSDELMNYLYSYNMPSKKKADAKCVLKNKPAQKGENPIVHVLKSAYATVPIHFSHE